VIDKLAQITGASYEWNDTYVKFLVNDASPEPEELTRQSGQRAIGVIAQDVQKVFPEVVQVWKRTAEDTNDYLSVDYGRLVAVLISAVNELAARLANLETSKI